MTDTDLVAAVTRSLDDDTLATFERRVDEQAAALRAAIESGDFENQTPTVGFELEAYAVDDEGRLERVPESVFRSSPCNKELGLHNVELNTFGPPAPPSTTSASTSSSTGCGPFRQRRVATRTCPT